MILFLLPVLAVLLPGINGDCVRNLMASGTPYEIGYCIGVYFRSEINDIFSGYEYYNNRSLTWYGTAEGLAEFNAYNDTLYNIDSRFLEELQGLADGSQRTYNDILLLNLEPEVRASLGDSARTLRQVENFTMYLGSADYVFRTADSSVYYVHQFDLDTVFYNKSFLLDATYYRPVTDVEIESILSFMIPGFLPGLSFTTNKNRNVVVNNQLFPREFSATNNTVPAIVMMRGQLNNTDANGGFTSYGDGPATSVSMTSFDPSTQTVFNDEQFMANSGNVSSSSYNSSSLPYYFHFNRLQHVSVANTQQFLPMASVYRQLKLAPKLNAGALNNKTEVLNLISDTATPYTSYPMYYDPASVAGSLSTQMTIIVTASGNYQLEIYLRNPSTAKPIYRQDLNTFWTSANI